MTALGCLSTCDVYTPDDVYDLLDGAWPAGSRERTELVDHLCSCRACQLELRAARAVLEPGAEPDGASTRGLLRAVRAAARREFVELLRELFSAWLRLADRSGRLLCEQHPRPLHALRDELGSLARRLEALGEPCSLGDVPLRGATSPRAARVAARRVLTRLQEAGDESWARLGHGLLRQLTGGGGAPSPVVRAITVDASARGAPTHGTPTHGAPTDGTPAQGALSHDAPTQHAVDRATRIARAGQALDAGRGADALALVEPLLARRADDLPALAVRVAARALLGDRRSFRRAAQRLAAVEQRRPSRALRRWLRGQLGPWALGLGVPVTLAASWLGACAPGARGHGRARSPASLLVLPAPHGRPFAPLGLDASFDE